MHHYQIKIGQRVLANCPEASDIGEVIDIMDRKHTRFGAARYRFRVRWGSGAEEWLSAGELKAA